MKKPMLMLVSSVVLLQASSAPQQKAPTLRDKARQHGQVHIVSYPEDLFLENVDQLVARSRFIIKGKVVDEKTRLTKDEHAVFTDYTIQIIEILKDAEGSISVGGKIVVSKYGGNIVLEGKPVRIETPEQPPVPWITPHMFFIEPPISPEADYQYGFVGGAIGAFEILKGKLTCGGRDVKISHPVTHQLCNRVLEETFSRDIRARIAEHSHRQSKQ